MKKQDASKMRKCGGCREARYCCDEHQKLHWPDHSSLCEDLQRRCDHPECERRAAAEIRCGQCNVATYCSEEHRSEHRSEHESVCEELYA